MCEAAGRRRQKWFFQGPPGPPDSSGDIPKSLAGDRKPHCVEVNNYTTSLECKTTDQSLQWPGELSMSCRVLEPRGAEHKGLCSPKPYMTLDCPQH